MPATAATHSGGVVAPGVRPQVLAAHIAALVVRIERSPAGRPFGTMESDVMAVQALLHAAATLEDGLARHVLQRDALTTAEAVSRADPAAGAIPVACAALAHRDHLANDRVQALVDVAAAATLRHEETPGRLVPFAWQLLFAAEAQAAALELPDALPSLANKAVSRCGVFVMQSSRRTGGQFSLLARFVYLAGSAAETLSHERLRSAVGALYGNLAKGVGRDGVPLISDGELPTRTLVQFALAAHAVGDAGTRDRALAEIFARRIDAKRLLVTGAVRGDVDFSPWIPLALLAGRIKTEEVPAALAPPLPDLPAFSLAPRRARRGKLVLGVEGGEVTVDAPLLDFVLDRALDAVVATPPASLDHGALAERILALDLLDRRTPDPATREIADAHIAVALRQLVRTQHADGTWADATGVNVRVVADDAHDPLLLAATALAVGVRRTSELSIRAALDRTVARALDHDEVGRYGGKLCSAQVARLAATLARVAESRAAALRALRLARAAIARVGADSEVWLARMDSDMAVRLALELGLTAATIGDRRAHQLGQAALAEVCERLHPSGAIPALRTFEERIGDDQRWLTHPTGTGPWPVRLALQLRLVAAAGVVGVKPDGPARALGFALLNLVDEARGVVSAGYDGKGRIEPFTNELAAQAVADAINGVAGAAVATKLAYSPERGGARAAPDRALNFLDRLRPDGEDPHIALVRGPGSALLARLSGSREWLAASVADAKLTAALARVDYDAATPGEIVSPPTVIAIRAAALQAEVAALTSPGAIASGPVAARAIEACDGIGPREARFTGPAGGRLDLAATGGLQRWASALELVARAAPARRPLPALWYCANMLLTQQHPDGRWPALTRDDDPEDVQLTVLEQLLRVEDLVPEHEPLIAALVQGVAALKPPDARAGSDAAIRRLALELRVAHASGDGSAREKHLKRLRILMLGRRGELGELVHRDGEALDRLARARSLLALAAVHCIDPDWLS